jgi:membrane-associated HD superfamily phosphohydrolase
MSEEKKVSLWDHEEAVLHLDRSNRRMMISLICVCLTFVITIIVFVCGYTTREKNWLDTMREMQMGRIAEVTDEGVQQQRGP